MRLFEITGPLNGGVTVVTDETSLSMVLADLLLQGIPGSVTYSVTEVTESAADDMISALHRAGVLARKQKQEGGRAS